MIKNAKVGLTLVAFTGTLLLGLGDSATLALTPQETRYQANNPIYLAQARTYQVRLGDTLSGIAHRHGVSLQQLLAYNPSLRSNPHLIRVGQVIYVSASAPTTVRRPPTTRQSVQAFNLPTQRRTGSNRVGARRGPAEQACFANPNDNLVALLPDSNFGYTLQDYPTFFWYLPELKSQAERFELKIRPVGAIGFDTYEFSSDNQEAGIMSVTLPEELGPLNEDQEYEWEVRVYCTPRTFITAKGNIKRLSTEQPELAKKLEEAEVDNYPAILAEEGVWYDSLSILAGLRADAPNDSSLITDWTNIMKMIGFENISSAPLLATGNIPSSDN